MYDRKKLGHLLTVENQNPHPAANADYFALLADLQGKVIPLLFTEDQIKDALYRAEQNPEDLKVLED